MYTPRPPCARLPPTRVPVRRRLPDAKIPGRGVRRKRQTHASSGNVAAHETRNGMAGIPANGAYGATGGAFDYSNNPTWRIFRIMAEFVEGFSFLAGIERSVTIFGSARLPAADPYYKLARAVAHRLAEHGFTVVTGGGPGVMAAANQGA